jgi:hypothetical protein
MVEKGMTKTKAIALRKEVCVRLSPKDDGYVDKLGTLVSGKPYWSLNI